MLKTLIVLVSTVASHKQSMMPWFECVNQLEPVFLTLLTNQRLCFWLGVCCRSNLKCIVQRSKVTYKSIIQSYNIWYNCLFVDNTFIFCQAAEGRNFRRRKVVRNKNMVVTQFLWYHFTLIIFHSRAAESHATPSRKICYYQSGPVFGLISNWFKNFYIDPTSLNVFFLFLFFSLSQASVL